MVKLNTTTMSKEETQRTARALRRVFGSNRKVADAIGVSKSVVGLWRTKQRRMQKSTWLLAQIVIESYDVTGNEPPPTLRKILGSVWE